jgi:inhibitor of cysteine peptidase
MRQVLMGMIVWAGVSLGFAASIPTIQVQATQSTFEVHLPANPTTGFQWSVTSYPKKIVKLIGKKYQAKQPMLVGSGGEMVFSFQCLSAQSRPHQTTMWFTYQRPWEKQATQPTPVRVVFLKKATH